MKCYSCGNELSEKDFCTACGADVAVYKKIIWTSNSLYNDGLEKARVRDLSGAVVSLRKSLKYNKRNIEARNLLGLVLFEMGEAVAALSEWIISKNLEGEKNIADDYIQALQSNPTQLDTISQTIKKYNTSLNYCYQGTYDLAVIQLKKVLSINRNLISGYQLLGLLYIQSEDYEKARRTLLHAVKIDKNNTTTLSYLKEVETILKEKEEQSGKKKKVENEVFSYQSGNDVIIQPGYAKEKPTFSSIINIVIGIIIGVAISWFLILPSKVEKESAKSDEKFKTVSEELKAEKANRQEVEQTLNNSKETIETLSAQIEDLKVNTGAAASCDYLIKAMNAYLIDENDSENIMESLGNISEEYLEGASESFKSMYKTLSGDASAKAIALYMDNGKTALKANDYDHAIEEFTKAWNLDDTNSDSLMYLAHSYRQAGDINKADELYRKIITDFSETQNAVDAVGYLSDAR